MKLHNTLTLPVPADEAWRVLLDIERIAPCVPGATLTSRDGDRFEGRVKVKLGPIGLTYSGTVAFVSLDEAARVAVLEAGGREIRGGGTARAAVTCRLTDHGDSTEVLVETDLALTGKPTQFGRGALADVAAAVMGRFAANLADEIAPRTAAGPTAPAEAAPTAHEPETAPPRPPAEPIDLLGSGGGLRAPVGFAAAGAALLILLLTVRRRRSTRRRRDGGPR